MPVPHPHLLPVQSSVGRECGSYEGEWLNDEMHGAGIMKFADGSKYVNYVPV